MDLKILLKRRKERKDMVGVNAALATEMQTMGKPGINNILYSYSCS